MMIGGLMFDFIADFLGEVLLAIVQGAIREYYLLAKKNPDEVTPVPEDENEKED
jgi:hypothetical protein